MSNVASDNLFKLVKSLSKPEKRYFKVYSNRHVIGEKNIYLTLFEAIDKQEEFDEVQLLKKFRNQPFAKRFSIAKNRLYNAIVKSLDHFHSTSSVDAQLYRQLHIAEILYTKTLYDQSLKQLIGARKVAEQYERYTILADIARWEKRILEKDNYESLTGSKTLEKALQHDRSVLEGLQTFNELWHIKSSVFTVLYKQGKVRSADELNALKKIIDNAAQQLSGKPTGAENSYMLNHIHSAYHFAAGDYAACHGYLNNNLKLIESKPHLFSDEPNIYISVLTNAIYVNRRLGNVKEALRLVNKLKSLPKKLALQHNEDLDIRLFVLAKSTELTLYAQSGEFEKGIDLVPEIESGLKKYEDRIGTLRKAHFYFNIAVLYFGTEQYHESLRWLNKLLNDVEIDKTRDVHCMAQILNLVVHIELGNTDLLPYAMRSTQRFLSTRKKSYRFENIMLDFVNEILKKRQSKCGEELYEQLSKTLNALRSDEYERVVFEYFDFLAWARSKASGSKYRELLAA
ncbi:MAG: hypothetical protein ACKVOR_14045 [Flavobacteriales bacterium]